MAEGGSSALHCASLLRMISYVIDSMVGYGEAY